MPAGASHGTGHRFGARSRQREAAVGTRPPACVGIGIDAGPLLLGRIGFGENVDFTVIGNAVNIASRLEALSKEKDLQIVFSREVARQAGWQASADFTGSVSVRGVAEPVEVLGMTRGRDLPSSLLTPTGDDDRKPGPTA